MLADVERHLQIALVRRRGGLSAHSCTALSLTRFVAAVQDRQGASVDAVPDVVPDRHSREPGATCLRGGGPSEKPLLTKQVVRAMIDQCKRQADELNVKDGLVKSTCGHWIKSNRLPDGLTPITAENAHTVWKPSLNEGYKDKSKRTPDSHAALFYRQVTGEDWACQHFSSESYDRAAKTYNRLLGRDREYEQARAEQRKLLGRKYGGAASGSSTAVTNAPRAMGGPAVAPPSAPREPAIPLPHAHGTGGASGIALGIGSSTVATGRPAPKPRRDEERFAGDYDAYRRADKAWHEKRRRDRLKSSAPYSIGARATSFNVTASRLPSASISSRAAATANASPVPSSQPTAQLLGALPLPDPASLLPPVPRVSLATEHEQRRATEAAILAERLVIEREAAATAHLEEWLIAEWERVSGELREAQLQQWHQAQSQWRPRRIVTDDDEAPSGMVSMCCAGDDHSEDEAVQPSPSLAARCGSTEAGSKHCWRVCSRVGS